MKHLLSAFLVFGILAVGEIASGDVLYMNTGDAMAYTNSGTIYVGGQDAIGTTRTARQQNVAYGAVDGPRDGSTNTTDPVQAWMSSWYSTTAYFPRYAFDGALNNFSHTVAESGNNSWLQVQIPASDINKVIVYNRYESNRDRLVSPTVSFYDTHPGIAQGNSGVTPLWTSGAMASNYTGYRVLDVNAAASSASYVRLTNGAANTILNITEVMVLATGDVGGRGTGVSDGKYYVSTDFRSGTGTMVFDFNGNGGSPTFDVLDVSGAFVAGGNVNLNVQNAAQVSFGTYKLIDAASYSGSFANVNIGNLANGDFVVNTTNLATTGNLEVLDAARWLPDKTGGFADAVNWSRNPANEVGYFGTYAGENVTASLENASLSMKGLVAGNEAGAKGTLTVGNGGHLNLGGGMSTTAYNSMAASYSAVGLSGEAVVNVTGNGKIENTGGAFILGGYNGSRGELNFSGTSQGTFYGFQGADAGGSTSKLTVGDNATVTFKEGSGSILTATSAAGTRFGNNGAFTYEQTGGNVVVENSINWADGSTGATTTANLSGGSFTTKGQLIIGMRGTADLTFSGDHEFMTENASNFLGYSNAANGIMTIKDNAKVTLKSLQAGQASGSNATINVDGGTLILAGGNGNVRLGNAGNFTLNQTGGLITNDSATSGPLWVADGGGSAATLNLSGGKFVNVKDNFILGTRGNVTMNISGTHEFVSETQFLLTHGAASNTSTINQSGGSFTVPTLSIGGNGSAPRGVYNLSGGSMNVTGGFTLGTANGTPTGTFTISQANAAVPTIATLGTLGAGITTTMSGGTLDVDTQASAMTMTSGTLAPGGVNAPGETYLTGSLTMKEGGTLQTNNIALNQPASQASNFDAGNTYPASRAVDGNFGNFSHTSRAGGIDSQWWQVELGSDTMLGGVKIYNRYTGGDRLTTSGAAYYFELYDGTIGDEGNLVWTSPKYTTYANPQPIDFGYDTDRTGGVLRMVRDFTSYTGNTNSDDITLNLTEVEVYEYLTDPLPVIQMDLGANDLSDIFRVAADATLDIQDAILQLAFIDDDAVEGTWQLFEFEDNAADIGQMLANIQLDLPNIAGISWDDSKFLTSGVISARDTSVATPEPATWVMLLLGLAGMGWVRWRRS